MSATTTEPSAIRAAGDRRTRLRQCTILLVDDEAANLDLLEAVLAEGGYTRLVRTQDALAVGALAAVHAPDLVLLDLHMPHRHGLDVLRDLAAATPDAEYRPVLVLTADVTGEARDRALGLGARDFVTKPFDTTEVLLRVENLLDTRMLHLDERRARARATLLAEWSRVLAASIDPFVVLESLRALVVPRWAAACTVLTDVDDDRFSQLPGNSPHELTAPIHTGAGVIGRLVLEGSGSEPPAADHALVTELAERIGLAAEHARLLAAAERATRERERLLAVVAHDLRNPLGAVAMYAEMLSSLQPDDVADDTYARRALSSIHGSTIAMQRIVEDLLDAASLRGGALRVHRAECRIGAAFEESERMLRPLAQAAGVTLVVEPALNADRAVGLVDQQRIVQLLSNLVGNAIKFTTPPGEVRVRYAADDAGVVGSVSDTGAGIAPDDLPHLFTAFFRGDTLESEVHGARRGVGLGLWIAQAIVDAHGGTLRVESSPGAGTTFHFTLAFRSTTKRLED